MAAVELALVSQRANQAYQSMRMDEMSLVVKMLSPETSPISTILCFSVADAWVLVDRGPRLLVCIISDFLDLFHRFECMF